MKINILGVKIDNLSKYDVVERIEHYLKSETAQYIVTPNPEFVLTAQNNPEFKQILNNADVAIPDGTGLVFASWWLKHLNLKNKIKFNNRIAGSDLVWDILEYANKMDKKVFILNLDNALSKIGDIKKVIADKYPKLEVEGKMLNKEEYNDRRTLGNMVGYGAEIVLVAFGAPLQEKWIWKNIALLPDLKLAIGIGGSFDFITGKIKRAPNIFRKLGLEWVWRLLQEPRFRIKRIYRAFVVFTWKVFWYGLKTKFKKSAKL